MLVSYFEDVLNEADIAFLFWYAIYILSEEIEDHPKVKRFVVAAGKLMDVFDELYEDAKKNEDLKKAYLLDENGTGFYVVREYAVNIVFHGYLFILHTKLLS